MMLHGKGRDMMLHGKGRDMMLHGKGHGVTMRGGRHGTIMHGNRVARGAMCQRHGTQASGVPTCGKGHGVAMCAPHPAHAFFMAGQ